MAIEAPLSKYKRNNFLIFIAVFIIAAAWFGYDGYFNENFKKEHTDESGKADNTLIFNQKAPPFFLGAAVIFAGYLYAIRNRKIIADENELIISGKEKISYNSIEKIDKTYFDKKGIFILTYHDKDGNEVNRKLTNRQYDNLAAILDHLVAKIS